MENSKPWYRSVTIWSDVAGIAVSVIALVDKDFGTHIATNHIYQLIMTLLSGVGLFGRVNASTTITK